MGSFFYEKKNSIVNWINYRIDFDPALTSCLKAECDRWDHGECFSIHRMASGEGKARRIKKI